MNNLDFSFLSPILQIYLICVTDRMPGQKKKSLLFHIPGSVSFRSDFKPCKQYSKVVCTMMVEALKRSELEENLQSFRAEKLFSSLSVYSMKSPSIYYLGKEWNGEGFGVQ